MSRILILPVAALFALVAGCGSEQRLPVFPVTGKVTFKGQPADGAQIVLFPVNTDVANEIASRFGCCRFDDRHAVPAWPRGEPAVRVICQIHHGAPSASSIWMA